MRRSDLVQMHVLSPESQDALSAWRCFGPLTHRSMKGIVQATELPPNFGWATLANADLLFMHRPFRPNHYMVMRWAKRLHLPVWVDWDDWLLEVPEGNNAHRTYILPENREAIKSIALEADVITVSTRYLRELISQEFKIDLRKIVVVPNAWDERFLPPPPEEPNPLVGGLHWRGTNSHVRDLELFKDQVLKLKVNYWHGYKPFWAKGELIPLADWLGYTENLVAMRPATVFVALEDSPFNRAKSNCAWIEATCAGAVTVAPQWDEWSHCYRYRESLSRTTKCANRSTKSRRRIFQESRNAVHDLNIAAVNQERVRILYDLVRI